MLERFSRMLRGAVFKAALCIVLFVFAGAGFCAGVDGVKISNFREVSPGIYAGARPGKAGIEELKRLGIKTIVDLENDGLEGESDDVADERRLAGEAGIRFERVPMNPVLSPKKAQVEAALEYLRDPGHRPVYVHCYRGSDRTGVVVAAWRMRAEGWPVEEAYAEMKRHGHRNILMFWWKDALYEFAGAKVPVDSAGQGAGR
ncbi:MAG: tyrosine-protein phosphatase [Deltaproteobacteria bacterium]|nr:tyrosine-protein phosphatase [Deltaproteobacteria bacterium]